MVLGLPLNTAASEMPARVRLVLKAGVTVASGQYTLGDIADVNGDEVQGMELARLALGMAPVPGMTVRWSREELSRKVVQRLGGMRAQNVSWEGAPLVMVTTIGQTLAGTQLVEAAVACLTLHYKGIAEIVSIRPAEVVADTKVPMGKIRLAAVDPDDGIGVKSRIPVKVDAFVDEIFVRSFVVQLNLEGRVQTLVAKANMERGQFLSCDMFESRSSEIRAQSGGLVLGGCPKGDWRLARSIAKGAVLMTSDIHVPPAVWAGQVVTLEVRSGAVRIQRPAIALGDGVIGRTVRVTPGSSGEAVIGEVTGPGSVVVIGN